MDFKILELRPYMLNDENLYKMLKEIPYKDSFGQTNEFFNLTKEEMKQKIIEQMKNAYSLNLTKNVLPCEHFVLYKGDLPVCIGGLRLKLNKYRLRHSGNIWYKTSPKEQNKGYATKFVELLKERAKELGMKEIFAQCNKENIYSLKVLKANGFLEYQKEDCKDWIDTIFLKVSLENDVQH